MTDFLAIIDASTPVFCVVAACASSLVVLSERDIRLAYVLAIISWSFYCLT